MVDAFGEGAPAQATSQVEVGAQISKTRLARDLNVTTVPHMISEQLTGGSITSERKTLVPSAPPQAAV